MTATCADTSPLDAGKFVRVNDVAFNFRFGVATLREIRTRARLASAICARQASEDKKRRFPDVNLARLDATFWSSSTVMLDARSCHVRSFISISANRRGF